MEPTTLDDTALDQAPAQTTPKPPTLLAATYQFMKSKDFEVPATYDEFEQQALNDPTYLKDLHGLFKEEKWTAPDDVEAFRTQMLDGVVKKKTGQDVPFEPVPQPSTAPGAPAGQLPPELGSGLGLATGLSGFLGIPGDIGQPFAADAGPVAAPALPAAAPVGTIGVGGLMQDSSREGGVRPASQPAPGAMGPSEQDYLDQLPGLPNKDYPSAVLNGLADYRGRGLDVESGNELVAIPNDYTGGLPSGTLEDPNVPGSRYFRRPLSSKVDGKEQSLSQAMGSALKNSVYEIAQGAGEGVQALANMTRAGIGGPAGAAMAATDPLTFGNEFSAYVESGKNKLAPIYTQDTNNANTIAVGAAAMAPLFVSQAIQLAMPEMKGAALVRAIIGTTSGAAFDLQMLHGARGRADRAGLKGLDADYYTAFDISLTLAGFKAGGKLMGVLGDKAALRMAPDAFRQDVAAGAAAVAAQQSAQLGRALTQAERAAVLSQVFKKRLPALLSVPKSMVEGAATFAGAGVITKAANQVGARALGGTPEEVTRGSFAGDLGRDALMGLVTHGLSEGISGAGNAAARASEKKRSELDASLEPMRAAARKSMDEIAVNRKRPPEGATPVAADVPAARLFGKTVMVRDPDGKLRLAEVHNLVGTGNTRSYIVRNAEGRMTRHAQGEVFANPSPEPTAAKPAGPGQPAVAADPGPARKPAAPAPPVPVTENARVRPGDSMTLGSGEFATEHTVEDILRDKNGNATAMMVEGKSGSRLVDDSTPDGRAAIAEVNRRETTWTAPATPEAPAAAPEAAPAEPATPKPAPTLGELVPDTTPVNILFFGDPVRAYRNTDGHIEMQSADGQTSVFDRGEQLNRPASEFQLEPAAAAQPAPTPVAAAPAVSKPVVAEPAAKVEPTKAEPAKVEPAKAVDTAVAALTDEQQAAHDAAAEHNDLGRTERGGIDAIKKRREVKALADAAGLEYAVGADNKVTLGGAAPLTDTSAGQPAAADSAPEATTATFERRRPVAADGEFVLARPDGSKPGGSPDRYRADEKTGRLTKQQKDGSWAFVPRGIEETLVQRQAEKFGFHADTPAAGAPKKTYLVPYEISTTVEQAFLDKMTAAERALADDGDATPTATITKAVADGLRPVLEGAIKANKLDVTVENITASEGGYTYEDGGADVSQTNPNITLVLSGNPAHIRELMDALNQGADQRGGNGLAPVTAGTAVDATAKVHPTIILELPDGATSAEVAALMEDLYKIKDGDGNTLLTGFTRVGDQAIIGSHFYAGKNFQKNLNAQNDVFRSTLRAHSIDGYDIKPYEVLSYERPADPAPASTESVAGATGGDSGIPSADAGRRNARDHEGRPLAAGFGRYYDSVLEGLVGSEKVAPAAAAPEKSAAAAPEPVTKPVTAPAPAAPAEPAPKLAAEPTTNQKNKAIKAELKSAFDEFKAARKASARGTGMVQSSAGGIGAFSQAESVAIVKMVKAVLKLGANNSRRVIERLRAIGLSDDDATDDQLRPLIIDELKAAGLYKAKAAAPATTEPADAGGTAVRQGVVTMEEKTGLSDELTERLRSTGAANYKSKPISQTIAEVDAIIAKGGIDAAYVTATQSAPTGLPGDVLVVLRQRVMTHYDGQARALRAAGNADPAALDALAERAYHTAEVYVGGDGSGTDAGRTLRAHQALTEFSPQLAVARISREVNESRTIENKKHATKARRDTKRIRKEKKAALTATLASPAVQTAVAALTAGPAAAPAHSVAAMTIAPDPPKWGSTNKIFTKQTLLDAKAALKKMGLSAPPPELVHFIGYHMEAGARSFKDMSERVIRDLGQKVKPLLADGYEQAKRALIAKGDSGKGFDGPDAVEAAMNEELGAALADRLIAAARPKVPGASLDPVREMLDTLTKKVRETLPKPDKGTPAPAREVIAAAVNDRAQYHDVFEASKAVVDEKIDALKISDSAKQLLRDDLNKYHGLMIGRPFAEKQLAKAVDEGMEAVLGNYAGKNRGEKLNSLATASDAALARDRQAVIDHVTAGITDPTGKDLLGRTVGKEFDDRLEERRAALRVRNNVADVPNPPSPPAAARKPLPARVVDLLNTRAKDERVAQRIAPDAIREGLADMGKRLQQIAADHLNDPTDTGRTLAEAFVQRAGLSGKQAKTFADVIEAEFAKAVSAAQQKAIDAVYSRAVRTGSPPAATQDVTDRVRKLYGLSPTDESRVLGLVADEVGLPQLSKADNTRLLQLANAIADAKGDNAKARAVNDFHLAVKGLEGFTHWQVTKTMMYANMLSGVGTQLKNVNSTGLNLAADLFYATGWAGFKAVQHGIRSGAYKWGNSALDASGLKIATAPIRGVLTRAGADGAWQMLRDGIRPPGWEGKFDPSSDIEAMARMPITKRIDYARKGYATVMKFFPRMLSANDIMWSGGAESMWAYNLAINEAVSEGRQRPTAEIWHSVNNKLYDTTRQIVDAYAQAEAELGTAPARGLSRADYNGRVRMRVRELMNATRPEGLTVESKLLGAKTSYNGPMEGFIGSMMHKVNGLTEVEVGYGWKPFKGIVPFTRIVANVANTLLDYTPVVGGWRAIHGKIGFNGNAYEHVYSPMERSIVAAKSMTALAVIAVGLAALDDDDITGAGPSDPDQNRQWQQDGHRPYTIKGYSYKDSFMYFPLAAVAAVKEAKRYEGADYEKDAYWQARSARMLMATVQATFNSISLNNLQDMLNSVSDPSKGKNPAERWSRYAQRTAVALGTSVFAPASGFLRSTSRITQQARGMTKREGAGWGMLTQDLPFLRNNLPLVYDVLGNEVPVGANIPYAPNPHPEDEGSVKIYAFLDANNLSLSPVNRNHPDMQILKLRNGALNDAEKRAVRTMTNAQRTKFLTNRLGGIEPMPMEMWQEFYPKRGKLIRDKLLVHLPQLELLAKTDPRKLNRKLKKYIIQATKAARKTVKGVEFDTQLNEEQTNPDE